MTSAPEPPISAAALLGSGPDADDLLVEALSSALQYKPASLSAEAFVWKAGMLARVGGTVFRVHAMDDPVVLKHFETGEERTVPMAQLLKLRPGIDFSVLPEPQSGQAMIELLAMDDALRRVIDKLPLDDKSHARIRETLTRVRWLHTLHAEGYRAFKPSDLWEPDLVELATRHKLPPSTPETLAAWEALGGEDLTKLIPDYDRRGGKGGLRTDHRPREMLLQIVADIRSKKLDVKMTVAAVKSKLLSDIDAKNDEAAAAGGKFHPIPYLSLSTIERDFNKVVTPEERIRAKNSKARADRLLKAYGRRPTADFTGAVAEFDDTDTRIFCISKSGLGWGRPWATFGIDQHSSYPLGRSLDNKPRSGQSAVAAYVNAVEAKDLSTLGNEFERLTWHSVGYPVQALFDNATYNSARFVRLPLDIGDPSWAQPFQPTQKEKIEYFNGTLKSFWATLPGWRGALDDKDALDEGLKTAVMLVDTLDRLTLKWAIGVYANQPMKDGLTPTQKYMEEGQLALRPRLPPDTRRLRLLRTLEHPQSVKWTQSGIKIAGLTYQDRDEYKRWVRGAGGSMRVTPRIDPDDLTVLYVPIPGTTSYLVLPCLDMDYARGMTLYQQTLVLKMCRIKKLNNPALKDLYREREALRVLTAQTIASGKIRERRVAERTGELPRTAANDQEAVHDVEQEYRDLDKVEMEEGSDGWQLVQLLA